MTSRSSMRGQRAGDLFGGGADIDEQRAAIGDQRRRGSSNRLLLLGGDEASRFIGEVLDAGGDDGAAMDPRQRALLAEIVEVLADGLRRDLETAGKIFHHHPAGGAGDVEDFGLAVGQSGHGWHLGRTTPYGAAVRRSGQRGRSATPRPVGRKSNYGYRRCEATGSRECTTDGASRQASRRNRNRSGSGFGSAKSRRSREPSFNRRRLHRANAHPQSAHRGCS